MSTLEVLQSYLTKWKSLLFSIGAINPYDSSLVTSDLENHVPCLPHQITFMIHFLTKGKMIHRKVIDECASTCIMSVSCWKAIGSFPLKQSLNTLEAFDGRGSRPYDILMKLAITLEGKTVELDVEVLDAKINYNLLLG